MNSTANDNCLISKTLNRLGLGQSTTESASIEIRISHSIQAFQKDWEIIIPNIHPLSIHNLLVCEKCSPSNITYRYAIAYRDQLPVMCAAFQVIRIKPENLRAPQKNTFLRYATHLMLNMHEIQMLVCGNVFKDGLTGYHYLNEQISPLEANALLAKCIEKIEHKDSLSAIMLKDMPEYFLVPSFPKHEKLLDDISMSMEMDKKWNSLEDYLAVLSKKYVARAKKILASASSIQVKEMELDDITISKRELHALYSQVLKRQAFTFGTLNEDYFFSIKTHLGNLFSVKGLYLDGNLVAFFSTISHADELEVHYIGIDYAYNQAYNLYFYIHFLVLQEAVERKKKWLDMGRTSLEAKAILGCQPHYNNTYISFRNSLAECAYGYFKQHLSESENWKTRNPLKTTNNQQLSTSKLESEIVNEGTLT